MIPMKASVIVTTYNNPRYLAMVLESLIVQTQRGFEVVVCDDGSGEETAAVIAAYRERSRPYELLHYWHEDDGFRPGQTRNGGIKAAAGDWLIFMDGDMLVHSGFVEAHLAAARPRRVLFGARAKLNEQFCANLTPAMIASDGIEELYRREFRDCREEQYSPVNERWTDAVSGKFVQRFGGARSSAAARTWAGLCAVLPRTLKWKAAFKTGSNISAGRDMVEEVNGFDETFGKGGGEDGEFFMRMFNAGAVAWPVLFSAVAYHLYHPDNWQRAGGLRDAALEIERRTRASGVVRCHIGLEQHDYGELR